MTLIVETGLVVAGAESYNSVAEITTYHANRGNTDWGLLSAPVQEQCARKATDYMIQVYRSRWKGIRYSALQTLDFPRDLVYLEAYVGAPAPLMATNIVPVEVKNAHAELSRLVATEDLYPDTEQQVLEEVIGPLTFKYDRLSPTSKQHNKVNAMLKPYLNSNASAVIHA
jgi:hypothetical protein